MTTLFRPPATRGCRRLGAACRSRLGRLAAAAAMLVLVPSGAAAGAATAHRVEWGGRGFEAPSELRGWLSARGARYSLWAGRHPGAAARLEGRLPSAPRSRPRIEPPEAGASAAAYRSRTSDGSTRHLLGLLVAAAAAAALVLLGVAGAVSHAGSRSVAALVADRRAEIAAAGVSVAVSLVLALLIALR